MNEFITENVATTVYKWSGEKRTQKIDKMISGTSRVEWSFDFETREWGIKSMWANLEKLEFIAKDSDEDDEDQEPLELMISSAVPNGEEVFTREFYPLEKISLDWAIGSGDICPNSIEVHIYPDNEVKVEID